MGVGAALAGGLALGTAGGVLSGLGQSSQAEASAQSSAISSAATAQNLRMQGATTAANLNLQAVNYDAQADYYLRQAGNFQLAGREEREQRGIELGQDKGNIVASAAGSGIDVSSRVVSKTLEDTTKSAYRDMATSARNEYENVYGAMKNRKVAQTNAKNSRNIATWANSAYNSMADDTETYGAITAGNILESGYDSAMYSTIGGAISGVGMGIGWAV